MKKSVIEYRLRLEMQNMAPDKLDELLEACGEDCSAPAAVIRPRFNWRRLVSVAALIVLVLCSAVTDSSLRRESCTVSLDVNPSIEFRVNGYGRVNEVVLLNSDAEELFDESELTGRKLGKALTAAVDELCDNGYLSADRNGILISVSELRSKHPERLCDKVIESVNDAAHDKDFKCAVLYQTLDSAPEQSVYEDVSAGKAALAQKLDPAVDGFTADELAELGIQELLFLASRLETLPDDLHFFGILGGFLDRARAETIAVADAAADISDGESSLVRYGDELAYKVSVSGAGRDAVYLISAVTGEVLEIIDNTITSSFEPTDSSGSESESGSDTTDPRDIIKSVLTLNGLVPELLSFIGDISVSETVSDGVPMYLISFTVDGETQTFSIEKSLLDKIA